MWAVGAAAILVVLGGVLVSLGLHAPGHSRAAPLVGEPTASVPLAPHRPAKSKSCPRSRATVPRHAGAMTPARPVSMSIPALGVHASVIPLGLNPDGTVAVPSLSTPMLTSWFDEGPAPGEDGPATLYGHVDTAATGPAVFYRLDDLTNCDLVHVTLADQKVAVFRVYKVAEYPKADFPTMIVYGDTPDPELRLITCGGLFDAASGHYDDNIVVYARLVAQDS